MGIAAMVIGIVAVIIAFIPLCGSIAFLPAIVGLILGIVDVAMKSKANQPKGMGIAGIVCNAVAIVIILLYLFVFAAATDEAINELEKEITSSRPTAVQVYLHEA